MGGAGVDRSRILGRRGPLSPAARAGPEHFGALDPARESPHGCLVECRAANESRSPALEEEKTALEKAVSGPALPLCYRGLNGCWVPFRFLYSRPDIAKAPRMMSNMEDGSGMAETQEKLSIAYSACLIVKLSKVMPVTGHG